MLEEIIRPLVVDWHPVGERARTGRGREAMNYEVAQSCGLLDEWRVEAIDEANDGAVHVTLFAGPQAYMRAQQYAYWKNELQGHAGPRSPGASAHGPVERPQQ